MRRAMTWVYWDPKSKMTICSVIEGVSFTRRRKFLASRNCGFLRFLAGLKSGECPADVSHVKRVVAIIGLITILAGAVYVVRVYTTWRVNARTAKFNADVDNLFAGLQQYKENVGSYPIGSNAEIVRMLQGNNPKKLIILVSRKAEVNEKGEILDPWGTALRIYFSEGSVLVRSAGANRRFDDTTVVEGDDFFRSN